MLSSRAGRDAQGGTPVRTRDGTIEAAESGPPAKGIGLPMIPDAPVIFWYRKETHLRSRNQFSISPGKGRALEAPAACRTVEEEMHTACLEHCLSEEERRAFNERGYLIVEDALPPAKVAELTEALDRLYAEKRASGLGPHESMFFPNFVARDDAFVELVDWPTTFPKVWGILGWNVQLYHSHCGVNPPAAPDANRAKKTLGWHQDSGRVNTEMESGAGHPRPRLSLKIGYFLSDVSEPGRGNFHIIPVSHLQDRIERPSDGVSDPLGSMPVCVKPGTAVFFDRRLWHAASPNYSHITRKVLFYGYSYRWLRTKDDMTIPAELMERSDPIRRQLFGDGVNANGHFTPTDADVPLRMWLREHRPADAD